MVGIYLNQINKKNKLVVKGKLNRYRDFIYIDDVLMIIKKCMNLKNRTFNLFNVSTSKKIYVKDLINKIIHLKNKKVKIKILKNTPGDQHGIYGNNVKIKKFFKIKKLESLVQGLRKTI